MNQVLIEAVKQDIVLGCDNCDFKETDCRQIRSFLVPKGLTDCSEGYILKIKGCEK